VICNFLPLNTRVFDMSFECKECGEKVSDSKMAGLVFGQIASATLSGYGIETKSGLTKGFSSRDFGSGILSGLGINCPKCSGKNWK
jgi:DNA-directed RNA polymerase subunit RPC12/RpoP